MQPYDPHANKQTQAQTDAQAQTQTDAQAQAQTEQSAKQKKKFPVSLYTDMATHPYPLSPIDLKPQTELSVFPGAASVARLFMRPRDRAVLVEEDKESFDKVCMHLGAFCVIIA